MSVGTRFLLREERKVPGRLKGRHGRKSLPAGV